ncbi:acyl carrier protein [Taibaiella koreensis]|uniref:acyl carrier protein n=1 Tax=Taibaiella koreensis TaxID=1268548 RepID=UPI000E59D9B8|nr:acyl carrier protein [Taibaiella koreensis]
MEVTTQPDTKVIIKEFLQKRIGQDISFTDEEDIFKLGLVNSLFALELVVFLETTFKISIENEDLNLENFSTVNNLGAFILKKKDR